MKDCIIIGKGPAGLSAALYIRRAGFTPLVIGRDSGALGQSHRIENYFGLEQPISGDELFRRGLAQVERLGIEVISDEVVSVRETNGFRVSTAAGRIASARTILLATGKSRNLPKNFNAQEFLGRGVSQCAQCDGFLMRNRALAVIGSGDHAVAELSHLRQLTDNLTLFTNTFSGMADHETSVSIPVKSYEVSNLIVDSAQILLLGLLVTVILPVGSVIAGFVIWFRGHWWLWRQHSWASDSIIKMHRLRLPPPRIHRRRCWM